MFPNLRHLWIVFRPSSPPSSIRAKIFINNGLIMRNAIVGVPGLYPFGAAARLQPARVSRTSGRAGGGDDPWGEEIVLGWTQMVAYFSKPLKAKKLIPV